MKKIKFYRVWKSTKPFLTIRTKKLPEPIATNLGFGFFEKNKKPDQWYRAEPKTKNTMLRFTKYLKKKGYEFIIVDANVDDAIKLGWKFFEGYEYGMKKNTQALKIAKDLILNDKQHIKLAGVSIGHFFKQSPNPISNSGFMKFAVTNLANNTLQKFGKYDFVIFYYEEGWEQLRNKNRKILVDHELCHCGIDGEPFIVDHDIQEFESIVSKYNLKRPYYKWSGKAVKRILDDRKAKKGKTTKKTKEN